MVQIVVNCISLRLGIAPIVCCFGWLGAKWKHFQNYPAWYSRCNIPTLSIIPPVMTSLLPRKCKQISLQYVEELKRRVGELDAKNKKRTPIVFHALSGNGVHFYGHVIKQLNEV